MTGEAAPVPATPAPAAPVAVRKIGGKPIVVTGDRPTGLLHVGHWVGSLENRVKMQETYHCLFLVADVHLLTTHAEDTSRIREFTRGMVLDWLATGLDPSRAWFYVQSGVPEIFELTLILSMLCTVPRALRVPTLKEKVEEGALGENYSVGLLNYPILMASDILLFHATMVPVGEDQASHLEVTRELARRFNHVYGPHFVEPRIVVGRAPRLMGTDGVRKMSKSLDNHLALAHSPQEFRRRVAGMFTDPKKQRKNDPGRPEVCNVFSYHGTFGTGAAGTGAAGTEEIARDCRSGQLGCVDCKKRLADTFDRVLAPIRERRASYEKDPGAVDAILREGTAKVRDLARGNLAEILDRMGMGSAP
ncbi:MAG: tryptophan--tRNA ligase [Planctomycetes bacterium]|nr:tryptophan--tRNA ligase [Planctomycetota bacterium]